MNFLKNSIRCIKLSKLHQAMLDESSSPRTPKDKSETSFGIIKKLQPSPARSSSSSSSGSYDLEDAAPDSAQETYSKSANFIHSAQPSAAEQDLDVSRFMF